MHARSMIEIVIAGIIALALLGYLLYALIRPEKF
ncbi:MULTISPECIES: K(+)-transporting ATPase subunit F [Dermacoccus]|nr:MULTISPECIES: K(+)-transporting ATPase subunit F [Dermacoccus]MBO1757059.1 K(+)-transporting ATPase subunit F [Dermacoccus sp. NHGro5]MBZ4497213.1 K(+)-transporting ATPase subunit F [Dermacoccus sp. Tok2021]MCG7430630.1 K(+)-transporting ATPase subunit F [Dermacoccus nishinomiyaensis]MCI0153438.1 K(+)-transporting ATPase subunit F [Dermacoccus nishinomiyaensis]MCT1604952.1 K(+)-transporting ATPase subunit F [Dermacoccus nishinomiyaensis]